MIDLSDLGDRRDVRKITYSEVTEAGDDTAEAIDREDGIDIMGALPGTCAWFSTGKDNSGNHRIKVIPWHRVISVENTVDR